MWCNWRVPDTDSPVLESGCLVPDSVDLAGDRGVPARRSVLGRRSVAQGRVPVLLIVLMLEVADDHAGLEQGVPVVAVEALLPESVVERFDVAVIPRFRVGCSKVRPCS